MEEVNYLRRILLEKYEEERGRKGRGGKRRKEGEKEQI